MNPFSYRKRTYERVTEARGLCTPCGRESWRGNIPEVWGVRGVQVDPLTENEPVKYRIKMQPDPCSMWLLYSIRHSACVHNTLHCINI